MGRGPRRNQSVTAESLLFGPRHGSGILSDDELKDKRKDIGFVLINGNKVWRNKEGENHRLGGPAVEKANGDKEWWVNGDLHREDGPAIESSDGSREWWVDGDLHREDGPALEYADGAKEWWVNGTLHRVGGAAVRHADGSEEYWFEGHSFEDPEDYLEATEPL